jgi:hypothetical protein
VLAVVLNCTDMSFLYPNHLSYLPQIICIELFFTAGGGASRYRIWAIVNMLLGYGDILRMFFFFVKRRKTTC